MLETFGFKPRMQDGILCIGFVYEDSPASECGLNVGDQIISINDIDYSDITVQEYYDILMENTVWENNKSIEISWKNSDGILSATLNKVDLFSK